MVSPSKKKVERRTKTGPNPSNSSATCGSRREKCPNKPLVSKPLANRRIYLDIKNHASVKKLSEKLIALGGKLELFLVREVDYVVTDRESYPTKTRAPLNQVPTPSPLPSFCSVSPATTDSPTDGLGNKKTRSRAEAMLERVKQQPQKNTGDILDNALSWKIPIYPLNKFLAWVEKVSSTTQQLFKDQNTSSNNTSAGRSVKVLSGSYIKIETGSRPEFKQFTSWPSLGLSAPIQRLATPVIAPQPQDKGEPRNITTIKKDLNSNEPSQRMTRKVGRTAAKEASSAVGGGNGYCEICRIYYDQLDGHTVSAQHLKLVTDSTQYSQLDSIIQQNNLGSSRLRKSLRIAKSPPPFLPPGMGGKQSSGSGAVTPGALEMPSKDLTRGLRLKECSVALGPPSPLLNGFTSFKSSRGANKLSSPTAAASPVPPLHIVMNGCGRRSQRSHQPLSEVLSDKETSDVLPATPVKDRNLRSRKANSARTPITPPPPERLPSPPPEKLTPPHLRSGSEKAMARSDRSIRRSEDRASSTRSSIEKEKTWGGGSKSGDKEKSIRGSEDKASSTRNSIDKEKTSGGGCKSSDKEKSLRGSEDKASSTRNSIDKEKTSGGGCKSSDKEKSLRGSEDRASSTRIFIDKEKTSGGGCKSSDKEKSLRRSEDRALSTRSSIEKEKTWGGGCKSGDKEKSLRGSEDKASSTRNSIDKEKTSGGGCKSSDKEKSLRGSEDRASSTRSSIEKEKTSGGGCKSSDKEKSLRGSEDRASSTRNSIDKEKTSGGGCKSSDKEKSLRGSEDRASSTRSSIEKEKTWGGGCKSSEKEKSHSGRSSNQPIEVTGMTTRSFRERSVDVEGSTKTSPPKSLDKPERHSRHHERRRRGKEDRDERSEDDESNKRKKKEPTPEEDFREERRRRREERTSCAPRSEEDDKEKTQSRSPSKDKWCTSHDRVAKSERSLRVKERPYYEELESEESSPVYSSRPGRPPKASHKKKRVSTKSRVSKKRLSVEEKLIEDNKSYYKVEVLNSKLRSTEYFVNQKQAEERVNGEVAVDEVKPVVVRFKKIRTTELALLSDEAENFMFGESKKEDSDEQEEDAQEGSEGEQGAVEHVPTEESSDPHSALKTETDSSSHSDLIAVKQPSSDDLPPQIKEEEAECEDDEVIEEEVAKLTYSFERPPIKEPWVDAVTRQREGREFYIPMAHDYPKVILPYEVKKQRRRARKSESGTVLTPNSVAACPSSPYHRKDRVSRLIQASIDDKPRKSPRRLTIGKREVSGSAVAPVLSSDNYTLKTSEEIAIEPEERCHASTMAIMSSLMRRRPMRECAEKPVSYEEESSLSETVESSGSNSNSMDAKVLPPAPEISRVPPTRDFELPPGGDKIAEALLMGFTHLDNYEPASCLQVDPACLNDDLPSFSKPGLDMPVEEILRTYSSCASMNLEEYLAPVRIFPSFYRSQGDSCASSDCSDFLGFMEDGQAATKKRKKRRNLTGWPVEKPRRKLKDKELGSSCLLLNNRALTPEPACLTSAAVTPISASSPVRRRAGRPSKIRPCLSATLPIPSPLASDHPSSPVSDYTALPVKKKLSRFGMRRSILKQ